MHLYFYTRGIQQQIELWKIFMQSQYFKWTRKNLQTGEDESILLQGSLRPSVLGAWEYIFPEECLPDVLSMMNLVNYQDYGFSKIGIEARMGLLRKIFGAKKLKKKHFEQAKKIPNSLIFSQYNRGLANCEVPGVAIHLIGYKKDKFGKMQVGENEFMYQELI